MPEQIPVSLVLTSLNEESAIEPFFNSLYRQTVFPAEIIICDAGSTDDTQRIIVHWIGREIKTTLIIEEYASIARGRNRAIEEAACEIIVVTDFGCVLDTRWIEFITASLLEDSSIDIISGGYKIGWRTSFQRLVAVSEVSVHDIPMDIFLPSSRSIAFRKRCWKEVRGYPEELSFAGEDTAFCMRLKENNKIFVSRLDAFVIWFPRSNMTMFIHQHFLYGIGDKESGARSAFYYKMFIKYVIALAIFVSSIIYPLMFLLFIMLILIYFIHLYPIYKWNSVPMIMACGAFIMIVIKELSLISGWIFGSQPYKC